MLRRLRKRKAPLNAIPIPETGLYDGDEPPEFDAPEKRPWKKWIVRGIAVVLWLIVGVLGYAYWQAQSVLDELSTGYKKPIVDALRPELDVQPKKTLPGLKHATTILLVGSDIRPDSGEEWGRSDTMLVARIYPEDKAVSLLSLPRDLYVPIPGHGYDKINAAYSLGGPKLLTATVREFLGVPIDHYFQIDFESFGSLVDTLDGVYLPVDQRYYHSNKGLPEYAHYSEINLRPGYQRLNAYDALAFVRYRHGDTDFHRAARQQLFLREVGRMVRQRVSGSVFQLKSLAKAVAKAALSDINDLDEALKLANTLRQIPSNRLARVTMEGTGTYIGSGYYVVTSDEQKAEALRLWTDPKRLFALQDEKPKPTQSAKKLMARARALNEIGQSWRPLWWMRTWMPYPDVEYYPWVLKNKRVRRKLEQARATILRIASWRPLAKLTARYLRWTEKAVDDDLVRHFDRKGRERKDQLAPKAQKKAKKKGQRELTDRLENPKKVLFGDGGTGEKLVKEAAPKGLNVCYPQRLPEDYHYPEPKIATHSYKLEDQPALALYATKESGNSILWMWTNWANPPILAEPDDAIKIGKERYDLFWESGSLRMVAWNLGRTRVWITNTLRNEVSPNKMIALARSCST